MKRFLSAILCLSMMLGILSGFCFAWASDSFDATALDYDALFEEAYVINGVWEATDLQGGKDVSFYFRGKYITEHYNSARHFADFDTAYNFYLSQNPDILEDLPVFIFAPGTYDSMITTRFGAIILGANAGIDPNADTEWTLEAMQYGVEVNAARTNETVFTAGLTRTTRTPENNAKWAYLLEQTEKEADKKADIKFIIDGIKLTGDVGISQYDYSNRLYTDLNLDGEAFEFTPTGYRTTLTVLSNSIVDDFAGAGPDALFSARCNSMNKNDAVLYNVRLTNIAKSAMFLFNKFFRNLLIDGMYYADSDSSLFGSVALGSTFCGSTGTKTTEYDQNIEIKNSVFYKNNTHHLIALGSANGGSGYTKMTANIHNNFFYDAVCFEKQEDCWGIFLANSASTAVEYTLNVTDNIIHQETTALHSLFEGSRDYQKSKTTVNFNRNKVTGNIKTIYPNTNWNSSHYNYLNTKIFYDFSDNFHAEKPTDIASRPVWAYPPKTHLANGYDYKNAGYYLDYNLTVHSLEYGIKEVTGLGNSVQINGYNVTADCSAMSGVITPSIKTYSGSDVQIYKDINCTVPVTSIDLSKAEKGVCYFLKFQSGDFVSIGFLNVYTGQYNGIDTVDPQKFNFPVVSVNTENGAPIVDKDNYVTCGVSITNADSKYCMTDTLAGIRYRGNSTLVASDKKPYRIKFDKKQNLFDMGKAKSWVLLANAFDKTMVRNSVAFAIGAQLDLEFTSEFRFVNVYLNGEYLGVYLLCEQTQTGSTRVDIEEDETGKVDTGYLIEMAGNGEPDEDRQFRINPVPKEEFADGVTANWRENTIYGYLKTPEYEFCTDEQVEFISGYVNDVNHAILTQDWERFNELCDVESFAKYFVTSTILNNGDGGYQVYMYKRENGGKLYAGPLWDFDQSSGATIQCGDTYDKWYTGSSYPWFDSFSNWPEFMKLAKRIYLDNYTEILDIIDYYTGEFYEENAYDLHANDVCWDNIESDYWRITDTIKTLKSYSANFAHLSMWFKNRISWLDKEYSKIIDDVKNGWVDEDGWYYYRDGVKVINEWVKDSVGWCYLGKDGKMLTNEWIMDSQGWCYVGKDGYCITNSWMQDSIGWCYLNSEGRMATEEWILDSVGWCYVGKDGYCITNNWMKDSVGWCYLDENGRMATNKWIKDSQGWCYVGKDGYCITNSWMKDSVGWCYLDAEGRMVVNDWVRDSQGLCYLDEGGYWNGIYY